MEVIVEPADAAAQLIDKSGVEYANGKRTHYSTGSVRREVHAQVIPVASELVVGFLKDAGYSEVEVGSTTDEGTVIVEGEDRR